MDKPGTHIRLVRVDSCCYMDPITFILYAISAYTENSSRRLHTIPAMKTVPSSVLYHVINNPAQIIHHMIITINISISMVIKY